MNNLSSENCVPVTRETPGLNDTEIKTLLDLCPGWEVVTRDQIPRLEKEFRFRNFVDALGFTNQIGAAAEEQDHHPLLQTEWGKVTIAWWTHVAGGLHRNDFVMAAKSDLIFNK